MNTLVIVPHGSLPADGSLGAGCQVVEWHVPDDIIRALGSRDEEVAAVVLGSDGLADTALPGVIAAIADCGLPVVEVRGAQWDGFAPSPLAAACKGVISGFGITGVWAAAEALRSS